MTLAYIIHHPPDLRRALRLLGRVNMPIRASAARQVAREILSAVLERTPTAMQTNLIAELIMAAVDCDENAVALQQTEKQIEEMAPGYLQSIKS